MDLNNEVLSNGDDELDLKKSVKNNKSKLDAVQNDGDELDLKNPE